MIWPGMSHFAHFTINGLNNYNRPRDRTTSTVELGSNATSSSALQTEFLQLEQCDHTTGSESRLQRRVSEPILMRRRQSLIGSILEAGNENSSTPKTSDDDSTIVSTSLPIHSFIRTTPRQEHVQNNKKLDRIINSSVNSADAMSSMTMATIESSTIGHQNFGEIPIPTAQNIKLENNGECAELPFQFEQENKKKRPSTSPA
eukprot:Awhi_evm1s1465